MSQLCPKGAGDECERCRDAERCLIEFPQGKHGDSLFLPSDLDEMDGLLDWLSVIEDDDTRPWAEALGRLIEACRASNDVFKALTVEREYANALEMQLCRDFLARLKGEEPT